MEILKFAKIKEQMKAKKKYLFFDQGIRNALLKDYSLREENVGFVVENVIGIAPYQVAKRGGGNLFYYKTNSEVDFLLKGKEIIPFEIKYRAQITKKETGHLSDLLGKMGLTKGIVITKDILKNERINGSEIFFISAWAFLLTV